MIFDENGEGIKKEDYYNKCKKRVEEFLESERRPKTKKDHYYKSYIMMCSDNKELKLYRHRISIMGGSSFFVYFDGVQVPLHKEQASELFNMIDEREIKMKQEYKNNILKEL